MARRSKKTKSVGRYGVRYGARLRKDILKIDLTAKGIHRCPRCRLNAVKRKSVGLWLCRKCNYEFTGGAWRPETLAAKRINRVAGQLEEKRFEE